MRHADHLIERVLFLDGLPNLQHLGKLRIGESALETMQGDLDLELAAVKDLREVIAYSEGISDYISRDLFKNICTMRKNTSTGWKPSSAWSRTLARSATCKARCKAELARAFCADRSKRAPVP
jgi:hypothetical protein